MTSTSLFSPFRLIDGDRRKGLLLVADHAGHDLPDEYGRLGLPDAEFDRHIAYDIGVAAVTERLAAILGVPAVMARFSRLLIDANRGEDDPTIIRQLYDGTIIPGNYPIDTSEREKRLDRFYRPYHDAVASLVASVAEETGKAPFIFSIHSFTPRMQGIERPWHAGVLWDSDDRAVKPLLAMLAKDPLLVIGDNEPYDGALRGDTMFRHAIVNGYAHALIEIRQDLIASGKGQQEWAERIAPMLEAINRLPDMHEVKFFGSRTGPLEGRTP
ncbi:MAG TPA: N-formylglutamate amidohydrolase [Rhizobiaceae bacterium]|nr:N-formylglutamate amidohydrolase [Rhizobiaceae bacterium]